VIDENLIAVPGIKIYAENELLLTETDFDGNFQINNTGCSALMFRAVGWQDEIIEINRDCKYVQLIMLNYFIVDFKSEKRTNKIIKRNRKKSVSDAIMKAISQKIFDANKMCNMQKL